VVVSAFLPQGIAVCLVQSLHHDIEERAVIGEVPIHAQVCVDCLFQTSQMVISKMAASSEVYQGLSDGNMSCIGCVASREGL
jgi:nickel-dependent lactate racemase